MYKMNFITLDGEDGFDSSNCELDWLPTCKLFLETCSRNVVINSSILLIFWLTL